MQPAALLAGLARPFELLLATHSLLLPHAGLLLANPEILALLLPDLHAKGGKGREVEVARLAQPALLLELLQRLFGLVAPAAVGLTRVEPHL